MSKRLGGIIGCKDTFTSVIYPHAINHTYLPLLRPVLDSCSGRARSAGNGVEIRRARADHLGGRDLDRGCSTGRRTGRRFRHEFWKCGQFRTSSVPASICSRGRSVQRQIFEPTRYRSISPLLPGKFGRFKIGSMRAAGERVAL